MTKILQRTIVLEYLLRVASSEMVSSVVQIAALDDT